MPLSTAAYEHGFLWLLNEDGFTPIDFPGAVSTGAREIVGNKILGDYRDPGGARHGFLLVGGTFASFDVPGAIETRASGLNAHGDIVGRYRTEPGGAFHGYLLRTKGKRKNAKK